MVIQNAIPEMIQNLMVLDFRYDVLHQSVKSWREKAKVVSAQNCRRHMYYGFAEDFAGFPFDKLDRGYTELKGKDAYAHLLQFSLGFEKGQYNTHNRAQFFEAWGESAARDDGVAARYSRIVALIDSDTSFLHTHLTSKYKRLRHEVIARDESGQKKGDQILIVGHVADNGEVSPFTQGILQVSESKQKGQKGFITVTHPDPAVLEKIKFDIGESEQVGAIRSGISYVTFDEFAKAIEDKRRVYITLPMGLYEQAEREMIEAWKGRQNKDNTLTHSHGDPKNKGMMSELWAKARLDGFINIERLRQAMQERKLYNSDIIVKAEKACWRCAEFRAAGLPINKDAFFGDAPYLVPEPSA